MRQCLSLATSKQKYIYQIIRIFLLLDNCVLLYDMKKPTAQEINNSFTWLFGHCQFQLMLSQNHNLHQLMNIWNNYQRYIQERERDQYTVKPLV